MSARRECVLVLGFVGLLLLAAYTPTAAQNRKKGSAPPTPDAAPACEVGCIPPYKVRVTPDGSNAGSKPAHTGGYSALFTVRNDGSEYDEYALSCDLSTGTVTCTGLSESYIELAPNGSRSVTAYYQVGDAGSGTIKLRAASPISDFADNGYWNVTATGDAPSPVSVTPHTGSATVLPNSPITQRFVVQNVGNVSTTYDLIKTCTGALTACSAPTSVPLGAGAATTINLAYQSGASGTTGTVTLQARQQSNWSVTDAGTVNVTAGGTIQTPTVDLVSVSPGTTLERSLCMNIAIGPAAAGECGDLRLIHALPSIRTFNKDRTPTLTYSSAHANPYPVVAANVGLPANGATPDSVVARLLLAGAERDRRVYAGTSWSAGSADRVTLRVDTLPSDAAFVLPGVYRDSIEVTFWYGTTRRDGFVGAPRAVVSRKDSPFGAGWWLAGLERLTFPPAPDTDAIDWIGGDGSFRRYVRVAGTQIWRGPSLTHPDTITLDGTGSYWRYLPHGVRVQFDNAGRHIATINRVQHITRFVYDASGRLDSIVVPPGNTRFYKFAYDAATGLVDSVIAPPNGTQARATRLTYLGRQLRTIRDPDAATVTFGYVASDSNRIVSRTNRKGVASHYFYDAAKKVAKDSLNLGISSAIVKRYTSAETQGMLVPADTDIVSVLIDGPRADVTDTTRIWLDRFNFPRKLRDPAGGETVVNRSQTFPGLITRVRYPNGRVLGAAYDGRGNVTESTDSSHLEIRLVVPPCQQPPCMPASPVVNYATTRYSWDPKWDFSTEVLLPAAQVTRRAYDPNNGNRLWEEDGRGAISRVTYTYQDDQLASVDAPLVPSDLIGYDGLGNLRTTRSPRGYQQTVERDAIGQDTLTRAPIDFVLSEERRTRYDLMGRVISRSNTGPAMNGQPAQTAEVRYHYDPEGNLDSLHRWALPDPGGVGVIKTRWRYDRAGRMVAEIASDDAIDSTVYDAAGNAVQRLTRRGPSIATTFDVFNRMSQRTIGSVTYNDTTADGQVYPQYPNCQTTKLCIAADISTFTYDAMGNLLTANNGDARIRRTYYPHGRIETDSMWIRSFNGNDWTAHVYGLTMSYDLNGRRTALIYPQALAPRLSGSSTVYDTVQFGYDAATGFLGTVRDFFGNVFTYRYDAASRMERLDYPLGHYKSLAYDDDGRVTIFRDDLTSNSTEFRQVEMEFDARDKALSQTRRTWGAFTETTTSNYFGLGMLSHVNRPFHGDVDDVSHGWDALYHLQGTSRQFLKGNWEETLQTSWSNFAYTPGTDRLETSTRSSRQQDARGGPGGDGTATIYNESGDSRYLYDRAGNEYWLATLDRQSQQRWDELGWHYVAGTDKHSRKASYYNVANRLVVTDRRNRSTWVGGGSAWVPSYEEYRYDALGRRVLRRLRTTTPCSSVTYGGETGYLCPSLIQRFIWDGDRIIAEIQYPGDQGTSDANLERDTDQVVGESRNWGRVLYVHSSATDHPLAVVRVGYGQPFHGQNVTWDPVVIVPHWNYEGEVWGKAYYGPAPRVHASGAYVEFGWFGSLLSDQADGNGVRYRRNRYYDPATGRFTQEDPVRFAGGLNLYGYANGDAINLNDPFGLCPFCLVAYAIFEVGSTVYDLVDLGATAIRYVDGRATKTELLLTGGGAAAGLLSFGGGYGRGARVAANRLIGLRGEAIVAKLTGLTKNTSIRLGSRIPDFVDHSRGIVHVVFHESKNARRLDYTAQLREMVENLADGQTLTIHVRRSTSISSSFDELVASGKVKIEHTLPDLPK